jgi:hypothetical protein
VTESTLATVQFQRVSVRYDANQDRLRVDAVDGSGAICALWITRRLAAAWVGALADWLKKASPTAAAVPAAVQEQAVAMESAVIVSRREREVTPAVPASAAPRLVSAIDLSRRNGLWSMVFKSETDAANPLPLQGLLKCDSATVHQLAQALVRQVQAAQWTQPLTLGWLADGGKPAPAAPGTLLN